MKLSITRGQLPVLGRFIKPPPFGATQRIYAAFILHNINGGFGLSGGQGIVLQSFDDGLDAVLVQTGLAGKLIPVPPPLVYEGLPDKMHRKPAADAQPQIIVFTGRQGLIEKAHLVKQIAVHHHR